MISDELTAREEEVKNFVCQGLTNKEIVEKLNIAITTVKSHLNNIYSKKLITGECRRCKLIVMELRKGK